MRKNKQILSIGLLFLLISFPFIFNLSINVTGGNFHHDVLKAKANLSHEAKELIEYAFEGLSKDCTVDFHTHALGFGTGDSGAWINPKNSNLLSPVNYYKFQVYRSAGGMITKERSDEEYLERLVNLMEAEPRLGRLLLFAFDYHFDHDGKVNLAKSSFYTPNDYVIKLANEYPQLFIPVGSIHPYRKNAIKELESIHQQGVRFIKWLPNSQGMDPLDPRSQIFFEKMKELDVTLITHTGHEKAVEGEDYQEYGNPLRFRKALDKGNKILLAHFASLGECQDLDAQKVNGKYPMKNCMDLFWRLFKDKRYENNLFGDTSGLTIYTRVSAPLESVLENPDFASRIFHGSDYPLPAINFLYRLQQYASKGLIEHSDKELLREIYQYNPLLFNFVLKRKMAHPKTKNKMETIIFEGKNLVPCLGV